LAREGGPEYFERDKIVTDSIVDEPRFCIDREGYLFASGGAATKGITPHGIDIYYLVGYLNSSPIYSYILPIAPPKSGGFISIDVEVIEQIPFYDAEIDSRLCSELSKKVRECSDFEELRRVVENNELDSLVNAEASDEVVAANLLRELSRVLVDENESLSNHEKSTLEDINDHLVGFMLDLSSDDLTALDRIGV
jgi:hypothetical protein